MIARLRDAFRKIDYDCNGSISRLLLCEVLQTVAAEEPRATSSDCAALVSAFDPSSNDKVSYVAFLDWLVDGGTNGKEKSIGAVDVFTKSFGSSLITDAEFTQWLSKVIMEECRLAFVSRSVFAALEERVSLLESEILSSGRAVKFSVWDQFQAVDSIPSSPHRFSSRTPDVGRSQTDIFTALEERVRSLESDKQTSMRYQDEVLEFSKKVNENKKLGTGSRVTLHLPPTEQRLPNEQCTTLVPELAILGMSDEAAAITPLACVRPSNKAILQDVLPTLSGPRYGEPLLSMESPPILIDEMAGGDALTDCVRREDSDRLTKEAMRHRIRTLNRAIEKSRFVSVEAREAFVKQMRRTVPTSWEGWTTADGWSRTFDIGGPPLEDTEELIFYLRLLEESRRIAFAFGEPEDLACPVTLGALYMRAWLTFWERTSDENRNEKNCKNAYAWILGNIAADLLIFAENVKRASVCIRGFDKCIDHKGAVRLAETLACKAYSMRISGEADADENALEKLRKAIAGALDARTRPYDVETCTQPKRMIIIRHGEAEHNINKDILKSVPDNAISLTQLGQLQALAAGEEIRNIVANENVLAFVSPYTRTRETFHAIARALGGDDFSTGYVLSATGRPTNIKWFEDVRLREMEFGNFEDPDDMRKNRRERQQYGEFYYRFPEGESFADVYDRVTSFIETLSRHWREYPGFENTLIVTHGNLISAFLMRWCGHSVEDFYTYQGFANCEFAVLEQNRESKLVLQYVVRAVNGKTERFRERARKATTSQCATVRQAHSKFNFFRGDLGAFCAKILAQLLPQLVLRPSSH